MAKLITIEARVVRDKPDRPFVAVADGTQTERNGQTVDKWWWLPRNQITVDEDVGTIELPEWLALKEGLI